MVGTRRNNNNNNAIPRAGRGNGGTGSDAPILRGIPLVEESYPGNHSVFSLAASGEGAGGQSRTRQSERSAGSIAREEQLEEQLRAKDAEIARLRQEARDRRKEEIEEKSVHSEAGSVLRPEMERDRQVRVGGKGTSFESFMKCKPPAFKGGEDPLGCLRWVMKMEQVFCVGDYTDYQKVNYAVMRFEGEALEWWRTIKRTIAKTVLDSLTWEVFTDKIKMRFCSLGAREKAKREFLELTKGNMTVAKYNAAFTDKLQFAGNYCVTEEEQIGRYAEGLPYEYQAPVRMRRTLGEAMDEASRVEYDLIKRDCAIGKDGEKRKYEGPSGSPKKKNKEQKDGKTQGKASYCTACNSTHGGTCAMDTRRCYRCGQKGHTIQDCKSTEKICYNCREMGHISSECTKPKVRGSAERKNKEPAKAETQAYNMVVNEEQ